MAIMFDNSMQDLDKLVQKAQMKNLWFCCLVTKSWYTPEEFKESGIAIIIREGNQPNQFINFHIADPKEGIRKRTAYLNKQVWIYRSLLIL